MQKYDLYIMLNKDLETNIIVIEMLKLSQAIVAN